MFQLGQQQIGIISLLSIMKILKLQIPYKSITYGANAV